jgi:hypothetical protein
MPAPAAAEEENVAKKRKRGKDRAFQQAAITIAMVFLSRRKQEI